MSEGGLISVDDTVPDNIKKCDECDEESPAVVVEVLCDSCGQWLCKPCDIDLHKKGNRAKHQRKLHKLASAKKKAGGGGGSATSSMASDDAKKAAVKSPPKGKNAKTGGLPPPKFVSTSIAPWNEQEAPEQKPYAGPTGGDKGEKDKATGRVLPKASTVAPWGDPPEDDVKPKKGGGDKAAKMLGASPNASVRGKKASTSIPDDDEGLVAAAGGGSPPSGAQSPPSGNATLRKKKTTQDTLSETFDKPASSAIAPWNAQEAPADFKPFGEGMTPESVIQAASPELRTEVAPWTVQDNDDFKKSQTQIKQAKKKKKKIVLEGFLKKKSPKGVLKVWQSRYFRLYSDGLQYFKHKSDKEPAGVIPIFSIKYINQLDQKKKGCRFDIVIGDSTAGRTFSLLANSFKECTAWVDSMTAELSRYQEATETNDLTSGRVVNAEHVENKFWKDPNQVKNLRQNNREQLAEKLNSTGSGDTIDLRGEDLRSKERMVMEIVKEEASGPIGSVYRAVDKRDDVNLAYLMHVGKKEDPNFKVLKKIFREMRKLDHPYIFKQIHYGEAADASWAVYTPPFRPCDSIMAYLEKHRRFPEACVRFVGAQLLLALGYLHGLGFIARNLSPENVYFDADGNVCLTDFLLALETSKMPSESHEPEYDAPESSVADVVASDWWRLGVFLYETAVGIPPVRSQENAGEAKSADIAKQLESWDSEKLRFPPFVSEDFKNLIRRLLTKSPDDRLGGNSKDYEDVKDHKFFDHEDINWSLLTTAGSRLKPPAWIKGSVIDDPKLYKGEPAPANLTRTEPEKFACSLIVEISGARGLKKPETIYCLVSVDKGPSQTTKSCKKTTTPEWDSKFEFEVRGPDIPATSSVVVDLVREQKAGVGVVGTKDKASSGIGSVAMSLAQIKDWSPQAMDIWQSVLDSNGLPFGELHVSYLWRQTLLETPKPVVYKQTLKENFFDYFGLPKEGPSGKEGESSPTQSPPSSPKSKPIATDDEKPEKAEKAEKPAEKEKEKDPKAKLAAMGAVPLMPSSLSSPTGEAPRKRNSIFGSKAPLGTRGVQPTEAQKEKSAAAAKAAPAKPAAKKVVAPEEEPSSEEEDDEDDNKKPGGGAAAGGAGADEEEKEEEDEVASDDEDGGKGGGGGGGDDDDDDVPGPPPIDKADDGKAKAELNKKAEQALRDKMERDMREKMEKQMREKVEKELREKRQAQAAAAAAKKHDDDEDTGRKPTPSRGPSVMGAPMPAKRAPAASVAAASSAATNDDDDDTPTSGGTLTQKLPPGGGPGAAMAAMASARVAQRATGKNTQSKPPGHCPECDCTPAAFEPNKFVKYNCKVCYHTHVGSPELDKKIAKAGTGGGASASAGAGAAGANKCSSCKCTNFQPNPFKKKVCNSCFHQHTED